MVRREVQSSLKPVQEAIERTEPALQQVRSAADKLAEQQELIESFGKQQKAFTEQIRPLSEKLPEIEAVMEDLKQVEALAGSVAAYRQGARDWEIEMRAVLNGQNERISNLTATRDQFRRKVRKLETRLSAIDPGNLRKIVRNRTNSSKVSKKM